MSGISISCAMRRSAGRIAQRLKEGARLSGGTGTLTTAGATPPTTPGISGESAGGIRLGGTVGGLEFSVLLEALEQKGMVRTLAEPNLTALSGQEAKFLAGGEFFVGYVGGVARVRLDDARARLQGPV